MTISLAVIHTGIVMYSPALRNLLTPFGWTVGFPEPAVAAANATVAADELDLVGHKTLYIHIV